MLAGVVLVSILFCWKVDAGTTTCQDIDHNSCVSMATQNPKMCDDHAISTSVCPQFCGKCPNVCYNCLATAHNMSRCNTITCGQGEKCMIRAKIVPNGEDYYSMICGPGFICSDFRKRRSADAHSLHERNVYSVCCDHDLCNTPALITDPPLSCYDCLATAQNISQCSTVTCAQGEKCMIRTNDAAGGNHYYHMMCGPKIVCSDFRKRDITDTHSRHERNVYSVCCDHDLCNTPSLVNPTTTTTKLTTTLTSSTTSTPPTTAVPTTRTTTAVPKTTTIQLHVPQQHGGRGCKKDVIVMIEDSEDIFPYFDVVKNNMRSVVRKLNIGPTHTRLAVGRFYNYNAETVWDLARYTSKAELIYAIDRLTPAHGRAQFAYNILAADYATKNFRHDDRPSIPDVLIIISQSSRPIFLDNQGHPMSQSKYGQIKSAMRQRFPDVISVAAGTEDYTELKLMATDQQHYIHIFPPLLLLGDAYTGKITNDIARLICQ